MHLFTILRCVLAINPLNSGIPLYSPVRPHTEIESDREPADKPIEESAKKSASSDSTHKGKEEPEQTKQLSEEEKRHLQQLQQRDREVRAHEQAHMAAAGGLARGGASFSFVSGPDGRRYATGGEVSIDTSAVSGDPAASLQKASRISQAALAPAQPSSQDMRVASRAAQMAQEARVEISKERNSTNSQDNQDRHVESRSSKQDEVEGAFQSNAMDESDSGSKLDTSV